MIQQWRKRKMSETTTIQTQQTPIPELTEQAKNSKKKRNQKKRLKRYILAAIAVVLTALVVFLLWKFVFSDQKKAKGDAVLDTASVSSITTTVNGSGSAKADQSSTITLTAGGTVTGVFVTEGQQVNAGDPLYTISSPSAEDALTKANDAVKTAQQGVLDAQQTLQDDQTALQKKNKELSDLYTEKATAESNRTIAAAFSGQLRDAVTYQAGDELTKGTQVAKLVDDSTFRLTLYFNYAYQGQIYVGQSATVSIPSYMTTVTGTVEEVNMVRKVSPEGSKLFQAIISFQNPGALADGLSATAVIGSSIYPYDSGTTAYARTVTVLTKAAGKVVSTNLASYEDVTAGQTLLVLTPEDYTDKLSSKQDEVTQAQKAADQASKAIQTAQDTVVQAQAAAEKAQKALDDFSPVSPITGTVISCGLVAGQEIESGKVAISIADTSMMTVTINVDERNISYVKTGMSINLTDWNNNSYVGTVDTVSLEGKAENSVTTFPVSVKLDNSGGTLLTGTTLYYTFTASQSENCIVLPINDVHYITTDSGDTTTVVFVKKDSKPDNAIDLPKDSAQDCPDGFYAVPVTIGISDDNNVELKEGVAEGDVVFNSYLTSTDTSQSSGGAVMGG
jgi:HlyD family secretion protein